MDRLIGLQPPGLEPITAPVFSLLSCVSAPHVLKLPCSNSSFPFTFLSCCHAFFFCKPFFLKTSLDGRFHRDDFHCHLGKVTFPLYSFYFQKRRLGILPQQCGKWSPNLLAQKSKNRGGRSVGACSGDKTFVTKRPRPSCNYMSEL